MHVRQSIITSVLLIALSTPLYAQLATSVAASGSSAAGATVIPKLASFSGTLENHPDQNLTLTFALYSESTGGNRLWTESQDVLLSHTGSYSVLLGSNSESGLPLELFVSGQARWLAVTPQGEAEGTRTPLVAAPYAAKSGDAEMLGGKPASAYVTTDQLNAADSAPVSTVSKVGASPAAVTGVKAGYGLSGGGTSGTITLSLNTTVTNGLYAGLSAANTFSQPQTISTTAATASTAESSATNGAGLFANATGTGSKGLYASGKKAGVEAFTPYTTSLPANGINAAVYGQMGPNPSKESSCNGTNDCGFGLVKAAGVWADGGTQGRLGLLATADGGSAGAFYNNGDSTVYIENDYGPSYTFQTYTPGGKDGSEGPGCTIDTSADLTCDGSVTGASIVNGRSVETFAMQSAENWYEDVGSAELHGGVVRIAFDPTFAAIVNAGVEYHVFLTPNGDCRGLYVSQKSAAGFEIRELGKGTSSISFDYRIIAKRRGHESERLTDLSARQGKMAQAHRSLVAGAR